MTLDRKIEALDEGIRQIRRHHSDLLTILEGIYEISRPFRDYPDGGEETVIAGDIVDGLSTAASQILRVRAALERLMMEKEIRLEPLLEAARERSLREMRERQREYRRMTAGRF